MYLCTTICTRLHRYIIYYIGVGEKQNEDDAVFSSVFIIIILGVYVCFFLLFVTSSSPGQAYHSSYAGVTTLRSFVKKIDLNGCRVWGFRWTVARIVVLDAAARKTEKKRKKPKEMIEEGKCSRFPGSLITVGRMVRGRWVGGSWWWEVITANEKMDSLSKTQFKRTTRREKYKKNQIK